MVHEFLIALHMSWIIWNQAPVWGPVLNNALNVSQSFAFNLFLNGCNISYISETHIELLTYLKHDICQSFVFQLFDCQHLCYHMLDSGHI